MVKLVVLTRLLERGDDEVGADILHFATRDGLIPLCSQHGGNICVLTAQRDQAISGCDMVKLSRLEGIIIVCQQSFSPLTAKYTSTGVVTVCRNKTGIKKLCLRQQYYGYAVYGGYFIF